EAACRDAGPRDQTGARVISKSSPTGSPHTRSMSQPLLFRAAQDGELPGLLTWLGVDVCVLGDVGADEPRACVLLRRVDGETYELCARVPPGTDAELDDRLVAGVADWLRRRGAWRIVSEGVVREL